MEQSIINIENLDRWERVGRGRTLQFFATDEEVQGWLVHALPPEYAPYHLVGVDIVKEDRLYVEQPFMCEISALLQCMQGLEEPRYDFWIWSEILTSTLPLQGGAWLTKFFSFNGLINLQHGSMIRDYSDPSRRICRAASSIGLVDRVRNLDTGEERHHEGYLRIYKALHKTIKKALVYSSIIRFPDGHEEEDTHLRMTEAAVHSCQAGFPFINAPGRLLTKTRAPR
jgi:hypothetical protein